MPSKQTLPILLTATLSTFLSSTLAQTSTYPPCVDDCITNNPGLSWCNGDETGSALDECACASYTETDPLITCLRQCTPEEQGEFAGVLPELCRDGLLPDAENVSEDGEDDTPSVTSTSTETGPTATETPTATESSDADAEETSDDTGAETDAAVAMGVPGYAIVGGLLVALAV
ncbi:uncharacterized protein BDV14DRAFT_195481 [Aspergillus stella-maris]|uniref:uncharacterized protein n=1 Tax=Aspergillus stella-maris TaxID=1810926 RepID=UPI003CCE3D89